MIFHHLMSQLLIHIGQVFISWSNWHYKKLSAEPSVRLMSEEEEKELLASWAPPRIIVPQNATFH